MKHLTLIWSLNHALILNKLNILGVGVSALCVGLEATSDGDISLYKSDRLLGEQITSGRSISLLPNLKGSLEGSSVLGPVLFIFVRDFKDRRNGEMLNFKGVNFII